MPAERRADRFATSPRESLVAPLPGRMLTDHRCRVCEWPIGHDPRLSGPAAREWRHMGFTPARAAELDAHHAAVYR